MSATNVITPVFRSSSAMRTVIGPLSIRSTCTVSSQPQGQGLILTLPCGAHITNVSSRTQEITIQNSGNAQGWTFNLTQTLYPGQQFPLPDPPSGQTWQLVVMSRQAVQHVMDDFGWVGLGILGLAGVGTYAIIKDRKNIKQKIKGMF